MLFLGTCQLQCIHLASVSFDHETNILYEVRNLIIMKLKVCIMLYIPAYTWASLILARMQFNNTNYFFCSIKCKTDSFYTDHYKSTKHYQWNNDFWAAITWVLMTKSSMPGNDFPRNNNKALKYRLRLVPFSAALLQEKLGPQTELQKENIIFMESPWYQPYIMTVHRIQVISRAHKNVRPCHAWSHVFVPNTLAEIDLSIWLSPIDF